MKTQSNKFLATFFMQYSSTGVHVDSEVLKILLRFIYSSKLEDSYDMASKLVKASKKFDINDGEMLGRELLVRKSLKLIGWI